MLSKNQIKYVKQLEQKKYRVQEQAFVAEGPKVVGDLLSEGFTPLFIYATEEWLMSHEPKKPLLVTAEELRRLSFLQHPQQVVAVFRLPTHCNPASPILHTPSAKLILALDGVQDPGNLGTIIRIADWFGIDGIVCSRDTADAWSPKVVQASMGSIARVSIGYTDLKEYLKTTTLPACGTVLDGESIYGMQLPREAVIVMGNEGNGISHDIRQLLTHRLLIPSFRQGADSLNVAIATAVTCFEFRRSMAASDQLPEIG